MELSSSLFSSDKANLNESDKFSLELEKAIKLWKLNLDNLEQLISEKVEDNRSAFILVRCFDLNLKISLVEKRRRLKNDYKQLLNDVLNQIKEVNYYHSNSFNFIERYHGFSNFILIQTENELDILESERMIRLINSSISSALTNTKCIYPVFLQFKDPSLNLSTGLYINFGIRIQFDSALFDLNQFTQSTLADFFKIFENKLKRNLQLEDNVRCFLANRRSIHNYQIRRGGSRKEDLNELFMNMNDDLIKEFANLKVLDHLESSRFLIKHSEVLPKIHGTQWVFSAEELITKEFTKLKNGCLNIIIDQLEQSSIFKSIFFLDDLIRNPLLSPYLQLKRNQLKNLNDYNRFCLENDENKQNYLNYFMVKEDSTDPFIDDNLVQFKSTSFDSIMFRFANYLFNLYACRSGSNNDQMKRIYFEINDCWSAIVDQLRRYWEICELIPCVEDRLPNLSSNLLTQKIQMLNCCIKEKQKREMKTLNQMNDSKDDEDEFYDCDDGEQESQQAIEEQAEGRLERLEFNLLNNKNKFVYKPITQDLRPYTEDNQDEYLKAYSGLNLIDEEADDEERDELLIGKNILLVSDMEAFKAANPEGCFEDFIHWYSPKDFVEAKYDDQTGQLLERECLSERFQQSNCLWRRIWQSSKSVPVSKQKRLFNYSMEAERALDYLNTIKFEELIKHLFSTLVHIGCSKYKKLIDNCRYRPPELVNNFNLQVKKIANQCKANDVDATFRLLIELETEIFNHISLVHLLKGTEFNALKMNRLDDELKRTNEKEQLNDKQLEYIVNELAKNRHLRIANDGLGLIVFNGLNRMFDRDNLKQLKQFESNEDLRSTFRRSLDKEFTFVADCTRPTSYSRKLPQKLNFIVQSNDDSRKLKVLMNGEFSEDIVYF